ncbi:uncharacterized protein LOC127351853 [Dicentrarchus labrax]|uniref:uncharacterized protein LOC127351853 n=1 Tax=Dicentrarchus labrax TaxID=13489 RepID=UPI0021F5A152|nr:uncharacterized protein LOC127351853 [Dicentrarchus labrax]
MSMRTRDRRRRERQRITMVEFKWIQMSLFLIALLHFTGADENDPPSFIIRVGDEVTLSCENVTDGQQNCEYTTWLFSDSENTTVELFELGEIDEKFKTKSDRLSVTANCSLVIKKVTVEDVGRYVCRQFISGQQQGPDSLVYLSVITMTEHKDADNVTLNCSVSTFEPCTHTVKWLHEGQHVNTTESTCYASVTFQTSHYIYTSNYNLLTCAVTDDYSGIVQLFRFGLQPSGEDTVTTATTEPTTIKKSIKAGTNTTESAINDTSTEIKARTDCSVLNYIMLVMRVAELLLITVITVLLIRARGNQRPPDDITVYHDEEEDDAVVQHEHFGETSASVRQQRPYRHQLIR